VRVEWESGDSGMLVYTDTMDAGWKAWDNGRPVPIYEVNGLFKGVWLGPGRHDVRFRYRPSLFYPLVCLSAGTLLSLLILSRIRLGF
jgi:uncharacterized membrane protein YfhO